VRKKEGKNIEKVKETRIYFAISTFLFQKELLADEQNVDSAPTNNLGHGAVDETLEVIQRGAIGSLLFFHLLFFIRNFIFYLRF
jgi:hypothetical protein